MSRSCSGRRLAARPLARASMRRVGGQRSGRGPGPGKTTRTSQGTGTGPRRRRRCWTRRARAGRGAPYTGRRRGFRRCRGGRAGDQPLWRRSSGRRCGRRWRRCLRHLNRLDLGRTCRNLGGADRPGQRRRPFLTRAGAGALSWAMPPPTMERPQVLEPEPRSLLPSQPPAGPSTPESDPPSPGRDLPGHSP